MQLGDISPWRTSTLQFELKQNSICLAWRDENSRYIDEEARPVCCRHDRHTGLLKLVGLDERNMSLMPADFAAAGRDAG